MDYTEEEQLMIVMAISTADAKDAWLIKAIKSTDVEILKRRQKAEKELKRRQEAEKELKRRQESSLQTARKAEEEAIQEAVRRSLADEKFFERMKNIRSMSGKQRLDARGGADCQKSVGCSSTDEEFLKRKILRESAEARLLAQARRGVHKI